MLGVATDPVDTNHVSSVLEYSENKIDLKYFNVEAKIVELSIHEI